MTTFFKHTLIIAMLTLALLSNFQVYAQVNVLWESRFTSSGQNTDIGKKIAIDGAGNVYVTGTSFANSSTGFNIVTIKYNSLGTQQWISTFNGAGNGVDEPRDIKVDNSGNVYVTGFSATTPTNFDYITLKYNSAGAQQWAVTYNGTANGFDEAFVLSLDASGNVYVTGGSDVTSQGSNFVTIKYNSSGVQQWLANYNGLGNSIDAATQIILDASNNVYITGRSVGSGTDLDFATIKYNNAGVQQWVSRFNGVLNAFDIPESITLDNAGNVYVAGASYGGIATENDYVVVKYNNSGFQQWFVKFDGPLNDEDKINDVVVDQNQNVYVSGRSIGTGGSAENIVTIKYNASGSLVWLNTYNGPASGFDEAREMRLGTSGALYVTGFSQGLNTNNDYLTLKFDTANGTILWEARFDGPASNNDQAFSMEIDATESIYVVGTSFSPTSFQDFSTIKWCQFSTNAGNDVAICLGNSVQLNATTSPGGLGITWSPSTGLSDNSIANPIASPTVTTTYIVSSSNSLGCVDLDTITVFVNNLPQGTFSANGPTSFCTGNTVILTANDTSASYNWSTGATNQSISVSNSNTITLTTTDSNGCIASSQQTITAFPLPNVNAGSDINLCNGASFQLNATGAVSYLWNTQTNLSDSTVANPIINPTTPTQFWVTGTNANGCIKTDTLSVSISISPTSVISNSSSNDTLYLNIPNGGDIQFFSTGSTNALTYNWNFGDGGISSVPNPIYSYTTPGFFSVTLITTNGGCNDTASIIISVFLSNSIEENLFNQLNNELVLFPNPTNYSFKIKTALLVNEIALLEIIDPFGKLVFSENDYFNNLSNRNINIQNLPAGYYFVRLTVANKSMLRKLSIIR